MSAPLIVAADVVAWAAGWIVAALVASAPLALATAALARAAASRGRAQRQAWLGGLLVASAWPLVGGWLATLPPNTIGKTIGAVPGVVLLDAVHVARDGVGPVSWPLILAVAWLATTTLMLARLAVGAMLLHRRRRTWEAALIDGLAVRLSDNDGPAVVGMRRLEIVLPRWTLALDAPLRALVLRHEEEHRRAGDPRLLLAAELLRALAPWNPALWWMTRRFRDAMELDCDARVLRGQTAPRAVERYGLLLLLISQRRAAAPLLAPALIERPSSLERRIFAMRTTTVGTRSVTLGLLALAAGALATACAVVAPNVTPTNAAQPVETPPAAARTPAADSARLHVLAEGGATFFEFQVTRQVQPLPGNRGPIYPAELRAAGVEGEVIAQFVVDTTGRAEMASFKVLKSNHEQFTASVREALAGMRFTTADVNGRKVRQLAQVPFVFGLSR